MLFYYKRLNFFPSGVKIICCEHVQRANQHFSGVPLSLRWLQKMFSPCTKVCLDALLWYGPVLFCGHQILYFKNWKMLIFVFKCQSIALRFCCSVVAHYTLTSVLLSVCLLYLFPEYFYIHRCSAQWRAVTVPQGVGWAMQ